MLGRVLGRKSRPLTLPIAPLMAAALGFEIADALGLKNTIHRDRVMKLVQSTRITPAWLIAAGYPFTTNLEVALGRWRDETEGRFD